MRKTTNRPRGNGEIMSENLAGDPITNQEWEKIHPATTITQPVRTANLDTRIAELNREPEMPEAE